MAAYYWKHGAHRVAGMLLVAPALVLRLVALELLNALRKDRRVSE
jgi:hypothetical protein